MTKPIIESGPARLNVPTSASRLAAERSSNAVRALCLDGGGYLGLATAAFLESLERHFCVQTSAQFDLFCGTSTGGIIALALAHGMSAHDIRIMYERLGDTVFANRWPLQRFARIVMSLVRSRYGNAALRTALEEVFGNATLGDLRARGKFVVIPAFCVTSGRPYLFKTNHHPDLTRDDECTLVDVALATSAAPTYFPLVSIHVSNTGTNQKFVDGGVFANNPALIAYTEAVRYLAARPQDVELLSISAPKNVRTEVGHSYSWWERIRLRRGIVRWGGRLADTFIDASMGLSHYALACLMKSINVPQNYVRFSVPALEGVGLDIATDTARQTLINAGSDLGDQIDTRDRVRKFFIKGGSSGRGANSI